MLSCPSAPEPGERRPVKGSPVDRDVGGNDMLRRSMCSRLERHGLSLGVKPSLYADTTISCTQVFAPQPDETDKIWDGHNTLWICFHWGFAHGCGVSALEEATGWRASGCVSFTHERPYYTLELWWKATVHYVRAQYTTVLMCLTAQLNTLKWSNTVVSQSHAATGLLLESRWSLLLFCYMLCSIFKAPASCSGLFEFQSVCSSQWTNCV